jgi:hypothetical protein
MTIKLTKEHFEELQKKGFSLDHVFLLMMIKEGHDIEAFTKDNMKLDALHQSLIRKALITDENKLTNNGEELLTFLTTKMKPIERKKVSTKEFDEWWEEFPSTDHFEYKGHVFVGSRGMRVKKEECKLKFNAILNQGLYTARQIIDATKYVVYLKKEASLKEKTNKLTFLQNSLTFLGGEHFVPFIDLIEKGVPMSDSQTTVRGGTDI